MFPKKTKYIAVKYHFIRGKFEMDIFSLKCIKSEHQEIHYIYKITEQKQLRKTRDDASPKQKGNLKYLVFNRRGTIVN